MDTLTNQLIWHRIRGGRDARSPAHRQPILFIYILSCIYHRFRRKWSSEATANENCDNFSFDANAVNRRHRLPPVRIPEHRKYAVCVNTSTNSHNFRICQLHDTLHTIHSVLLSTANGSNVRQPIHTESTVRMADCILRSYFCCRCALKRLR